ncbi:MAG: histidinol-phosphatase HisJ family protein [Clostridia bacterium]|nr:histidinol-phosphatase HisJ family protein [Clostridia bacterium]
MIRNNYHTHTVYCDGADTPEELVLYAISENCSEIGFSGHSYTNIEEDSPFCMTLRNTEVYKSEISRLKEKYKDKIKIYLGVEQDYYSSEKTDDYDYVIGAVHYVFKNGCYISVDHTRETQIEAVMAYYNNDFYAFAEDYYELVGDLYNKTRCDIIAHFDLITKFNEGNCLFDTNHPRYIKAADAALDKLFAANVKFEINYGAVARGYRTTPYPDERIIKRITDSGKPIIYSSDCHKKEYLLFGIPE